MNRTLPLDIEYDSTGAIFFIIVVLIWYSFGIVCMLGMQIKAVEDSARRRTKLLIDNLRDQTHTKQILEELVDKQNRDKLWYLYFDRTTDEKLIQADSLRIRNIEKQLAIINQTSLLINETRTILPDWSLMENRMRIRRRSSFDQEILERWKFLVEQCKTPEQLPWKIQKLILRRHFHRHCKKHVPI